MLRRELIKLAPWQQHVVMYTMAVMLCAATPLAGCASTAHSVLPEKPLPILVPEQAAPSLPPVKSEAPAVQPPPVAPLPTVSPAPVQPLTNPAPVSRDLKPLVTVPALVIGTEGVYTVKRGDTIRLVSAKLGVPSSHLIQANRLAPQKQLSKGQPLRYDNRRIVPMHPLRNGILINIPDRTLYYFDEGALTFSTPVALGTPVKTDQMIWHTPTGRFKIVNKIKDPTWTVPPSIQEEMRLNGKEIITAIPPGPENPLGKFAMRTSLPGILIHSTTKPWSIYSFASHGCIRVYPERMEQLFNLTKVNTSGEIIYHPVKIATTPEGKILLEVHADIYNKSKGLQREAKELIQRYGLDEYVDWEKVKLAIKKRTGIAVEITKPQPPAHQDQAQTEALPTKQVSSGV